MELVLVLPTKATATQVDNQTNKDLAIVNLGDSKQNKKNSQTNKQTHERTEGKKEPIGYIPKHSTRLYFTNGLHM